MALEQLAERRGGKVRPEDVAISGRDKGTAESMRDRALREFLDKQAAERNRRQGDG